MPNIYLNKKEIEMLENVISSYRNIMSEGDETAPIIDKEDEILQPIINKLIKADQKPTNAERRKIVEKINKQYDRIKR